MFGGRGSRRVRSRRALSGKRPGRTLSLGLGFILVAVMLSAGAATAATAYIATQSGDWDDSSTWGGVGPPLVLTVGDTVSIPAGITVTIPVAVTVDSTDAHIVVGIGAELRIDGRLDLEGTDFFNFDSSLTNRGTLTVNGVLDFVHLSEFFNAGSTYNHGTFDLGPRGEGTNAPGALIENRDFMHISTNASLENRGTFDNHGELELFFSSVITPINGKFFHRGGSFTNRSSGLIDNGGLMTNSTSSFVNHGRIELPRNNNRRGILANSGAGTAVIDNFGIINVEDTLRNQEPLHRIVNHSGGIITVLDRGDIFVNGGLLFQEFSGMIDIEGGGALNVASGAQVDNDSTISNGGLIDNAGTVRNLCNGVITGNPVTGNPPIDICDTIPPELVVPGEVLRETTNPAGTIVSYIHLVSATDDFDPNPTVVCAPASGSFFALGTTQVTCTATDEFGNNTEAVFDVVVRRIGVDVEKSTNGEDADDPAGPEIRVGDPVTWTYVVINTGELPLASVTVIDDNGTSDPGDDFSPGLVGGDTNDNGFLEPSETWVYEASGVALRDQQTNLVRVEAVSPAGNVVSDEDASNYRGLEPGIDLEKLTNGHDADAPPGPSIAVGEPVTWKFVVTNTGNVPLTGVFVSDDQGVAVTCLGSSLDPGESMTCTGSGTAMAGPYKNVGTASAQWRGEWVTDRDPSHHTGLQGEYDLKIVKRGPRFAAPGSTVTYHYYVWNQWPASAVAPTVVDDKCGSVEYHSGDLNGDGLAQFGEPWRFTCDYEVTEGPFSMVVNIATVGPLEGDFDPDDNYAWWWMPVVPWAGAWW